MGAFGSTRLCYPSQVHHYILPNGKSYRKKGRGDKGARRDIWDNETVDADALVFAHAVDSFWPPT